MNRNQQLESLKENLIWDIIVIGGGATGLGSTLDAASRGLKVLCVEKTDFSKGASSRSTKLIHGGVRYLEQGNFNMVRHALQERWFLLKNAPELTRKLSFVLPTYSWFNWLYFGLGLLLYDLLSGKLSIGKTRFLNKNAVIKKIPQISTNGLVGGIRYFDGQFDDSEMCVALVNTAIKHEATVINHMEATGFEYDTHGKINGVKLLDTLNNTTNHIQTKSVINATGVFVEDILKMDQNNTSSILKPSRGVHLVVDKKYFDANHALIIPKTSDGRVLFAVPWHDKVVIGTTDTPTEYKSDEPKYDDQEIDFILSNFNQYMSSKISRKDVLSVFCGLRPLIKHQNFTSTAQIVRDHTIIVSPSGLITITGGKWTTYRKMAQDVVDKTFQIHHLPFKKSNTQNIHILKPNRPKVINGDKKIHPNFEFSTTQVLYAIRDEMACTIEDILARRLRLLFLDATAAKQAAPIVGRILQKELNKDEQWFEDQLSHFENIANRYVLK